MHSWKHSNYLLLIYQLHVSIRICYITCPTCSRALRVLVPHVSRVLCAFDLYVLSCPTCYRVPRSSCHTWYRTSCGLCPTCSCVSRASCFFFFFFFFFYNAKYNKCLVPYWPRVSRFMSRFSLRILLFRTLRTLCPSITFCALEFPCISLLFFCPFSTYDFLEEIY